MSQSCHFRSAIFPGLAFLVACGPPLLEFGEAYCQDESRVAAGLQSLYRFDGGRSDSPDPNQIVDQGYGQPLHLRIETASTAKKSGGTLTVTGKSRIRSQKRASKIHRAVTWTNELTVEVWLQPKNKTQKGPARIVSFSRNGNQRNFTLGQEGDKFDFRLRTNRTSDNGIPSISTQPKTVSIQPTHVVYSRDRAGDARIYLNGKLAVQGNVPGDLSNWDPNYELVLANELSGDRVWQGKIHLVAIYNRRLSSAEIQQNFRAGKDGQHTSQRVTKKEGDLFTRSIAPIIARHCLECHDSFNQKGDLDLSRRDAAFRGGESGVAIVKGDPNKGTLWHSIQQGEMPKDRDPLSEQEKKAIFAWLQQGAQWPLERIDPAVFLRDRKVDSRLLRRLTVAEYIESVRTAVGVDIENEARTRLPKDLRADGFNNTAYNLNIDLKHVETYSVLAEKIVSQIDLPRFVKRFTGSTDLKEATVRELVAKMGRWVLRGPLDEVELRPYLQIAETVRLGGGKQPEAVRYILESMLQSPRFVYMIERQQGDGTLWPISPHEMANRISFTLWGSPPDEELFQLAQSGRIVQPEIIDQQIDRLLAHPQAIVRWKQFLSQWLHLDRLSSLKPNPKKYPRWNPRLAQDMVQETLLFSEEIIWKQNRPVADLFNARETFLNDRLAKHYGIDVPTALPKDKLVRVQLGKESGRGGLLTQGSSLTVGGDEASMVSRGLFVLHDVLRGIVKDPPPCVDTTPVPTKAGLTQRSIAIARIKNVNCGGCHGRFEPLAFGLEKFDGLGSLHQQDEHGNQLRDDGEILFPGTDKSIRYTNSLELMELIAQSDRLFETVAWKLTQFSIGRPLGAADAKQVEEIVARAKKKGSRYQGLIREIIRSDLVSKIKTDPYPSK